MSWESRRKGATYYYRKEWRNGTCVSRYVGAGTLANLSAYVDARERTERQLSRLDLAELQASNRRADQAIDNYRRQVWALVASALSVAGYHQHHRGEWRKRRNMAETIEINKTVATMPVRHLGILAGSVEEEILRCAGVGKTQNVAKVIHAECAGVRARLGWADAPQHERLLIECISLCWLRVQLLEQFHSQNTTGDGYQMAVAEHFERRLSAAHRRYLEAVTALARVRKLGVNVQINVANQQVVQNG